MILGILTARESLPPSHITHLAQLAKQKNIQIVCFQPQHIQPVTHQVKGHQFNLSTDEWIKNEFPLPTLLYDQCFYATKQSQRQNQPIIDWLQSQENIVFLNHSLSNFMEIYQFLQTIPFFQPFLLPITPIQQSSEVTHALQLKKEIILEPLTCNPYQSQIRLLHKNTGLHLFTKKHEKILELTFDTPQMLENFLQKQLCPQSYMIRTPINFYTRQGEPFLIRQYIQKNIQARWQTVGQIAMINPKRFIQTPEHAEEKVIRLQPFLHQHILRRTSVMQDLQRIAHQFPVIIDKYFQNQFEMTLDFVCDMRGRIFLQNWNHMPTPHVKAQFQNHTAYPLQEAILDYAQCVSSNEQKRI